MSNEPSLNNSQTDWQRLDAMRDEDIDLSDCPEATPAQFDKAVIRKRGKSAIKTTAVQIDIDVLEWFKSQGQGYQTQINQLLRSYMESHQS